MGMMTHYAQENEPMKIALPKVQLLAYTKPTVAAEALLDPDPDATGMDHLLEVAGRSCYESWNRPNARTAENSAYVANILRQKHTSVLEHSSATFYLTGVSRALLAEITRHRQLSFSVRSQRFVDESESQYVIPPAARDLLEDGGLEAFDRVMEYSAEAYDLLVDQLRLQGLGRKQAREAARAVLPNMVETRIVITGNLRAWREMLVKRLSTGADAEIREVSEMILKHLEGIAPAAMQGIREETS